MNPRWLLRLLLLWAALSALALFFGEHYGRLLLPLYRWEVEKLLPEYRVRSMAIRRDGQQQVFHMRVESRTYVVVGAKVIPKGIGATTQTLLGHALQHAVVLFTALGAWPLSGIAARAKLLLLGIPLLLVVEVLDVPFVLAGSVRDIVLANFSPAELSSSILVQCMGFLNSGGRVALSLAAGLAAAGTMAALDQDVPSRLADARASSPNRQSTIQRFTER